MALTAIHLHGPLAKEFGKVWHLDIDSPAEAVRAISANRPAFAQRIMDLDAKGLVFRVRHRHGRIDEDLVEDTLTGPVGKNARVDIVPIVRGASAGVRFVIGAALIAIGTLAPVDPGMKSFLISTGVGMVSGAISEWLTPTPNNKQAASLNSYSFSGPTNNVGQGLPVPVIYGEVMAGSYTVSALVSTEDLVGGGSLGMEIDGTTSLMCHIDTLGASCMNTCTLFARPSGVVPELYYSWSIDTVNGTWLIPTGNTQDNITISARNTYGISAVANVTCTCTDTHGTQVSATVQLKSEHLFYEPSYAG